MTYRHFPHMCTRIIIGGVVLAMCRLPTALGDDLSQFRLETNNAFLGQGIVVAQPEASGLVFEINPSTAGITVPVTYVFYNNGFVTTPTFNLSFWSGHADAVAGNLAGTGSGVAPSLAKIINYEADFYVGFSLLRGLSLTGSPKIINQSFIEVPNDTFTAPVLDQFFDNYVAKWHYLIVTAAGNGGDVITPGTAYNVITVGAYGGASSFSQPGQRSKPDIVAPASATSFATPIVSGVAALMMQVAGSGDGVDTRVMKAILLNGATKPAGWTHSSDVPLDRVFGAGIVSAVGSYHNLIAGEHGATSTTLTTSLGGDHLPTSSGNVGTAGWNLKSLVSSPSSDAVDHYVIDLSQSSSIFNLTATLTWQRANDSALNSEYLANASNSNFANFTSSVYTINNLDMYIYNVTTQQQVDLSNSAVDNVEHLYTLNLTPGKYDLQVLKHGGNPGSVDVFSNSETYGLAWNAGLQSTIVNNANLTFSQTGSSLITTLISGSGTIRQSGAGVTTLANYRGIGSLQITGGQLILGPTAGVRQTGAVLTICSGLAISGATSAIDLTNNDMLIHDADFGEVYQLVVAGYNMGTWNGPGIRSSEASANQMLIGIMSGQEWLESVGGYFDDQPVVSTDVLLKYTYAGDFNFDGIVDDNDLTQFLNYYYRTGSGIGDYSHADQTFDGLVDDNDLIAFLNNYNQPSSALSAGIETGLQPTFGIGSNTAPEPSSLALVLMGILGLLRRSRRHTRSRFVSEGRNEVWILSGIC